MSSYIDIIFKANKVVSKFNKATSKSAKKAAISQLRDMHKGDYTHLESQFKKKIKTQLKNNMNQLGGTMPLLKYNIPSKTKKITKPKPTLNYFKNIEIESFLNGGFAHAELDKSIDGGGKRKKKKKKKKKKKSSPPASPWAATNKKAHASTTARSVGKKRTTSPMKVNKKLIPNGASAPAVAVKNKKTQSPNILPKTSTVVAKVPKSVPGVKVAKPTAKAPTVVAKVPNSALGAKVVKPIVVAKMPKSVPGAKVVKPVVVAKVVKPVAKVPVVMAKASKSVPATEATKPAVKVPVVATKAPNSALGAKVVKPIAVAKVPKSVPGAKVVKPVAKVPVVAAKASKSVPATEATKPAVKVPVAAKADTKTDKTDVKTDKADAKGDKPKTKKDDAPVTKGDDAPVTKEDDAHETKEDDAPDTKEGDTPMTKDEYKPDAKVSAKPKVPTEDIDTPSVDVDDDASLSSLADFRDNIANVPTPQDKIIEPTLTPATPIVPDESLNSETTIPTPDPADDSNEATVEADNTPVILDTEPTVETDGTQDIIAKTPNSNDDAASSIPVPAAIEPANGIPLNVFEPTIKKTLDNLVGIIDNSMTTNKLDSDSANFLDQMRTLNASIPTPVPLTSEQNIVLVNRLAIDLFHTFKNIKDDIVDIPSLTKAQKKAILNSVVTHSLNLLGDFDSVMKK